MKKIEISINQIKTTLEKILTSNGLTKKEAKIVAEEYLIGELQGKFSHGLMAFPALVDKLNSKRKSYKILRQTHATVLIDAQKNLGAIIGRKAAKLAIKMAGVEGIGLALIKNMITWLRPGTIAQYIAHQGYVGIVINNGGKPITAPPGGYDPVIGTNPIAIGIPTNKLPIIADMATSVRAWGEVRIAERMNRKLPKNIFYNKFGQFAIRPQDAYSVLPMGDYKGFALGLLIEILTGSFLGRKMGKQLVREDYRVVTRGGLIIVLNPRIAASFNQFKQANSHLIKEIKRSRKIKKGQKIILPGERAATTAEHNLKRGYLTIDQLLWSLLNNLAKKSK